MRTSLRDFYLENDVVGVLLDCPQYDGDFDADWFVDELLGETVCHLQKNRGRQGLVKSLAEKFGTDISANRIKARLVQIQQESRSYALVYFLPKYAARLQDLWQRRQKLAAATELAKAAFEGVAVAG